MSQPKSNEGYKDTAERYVREQLPELRFFKEPIIDERKNKEIGRDIQLHHWLKVLVAEKEEWRRCVLQTGFFSFYGVNFDSTTGQPATEADYKAFCEIVGITSEENLSEIETDYTQVKVITNGDKQ